MFIIKHASSSLGSLLVLWWDIISGQIVFGQNVMTFTRLFLLVVPVPAFCSRPIPVSLDFYSPFLVVSETSLPGLPIIFIEFFLQQGGMADEDTIFYKHLVSLGWVRCCLSFSLLCSSIRCIHRDIHGSRIASGCLDNPWQHWSWLGPIWGLLCKVVIFCM